MFLKRVFSHYKQEVMVLKESLELAMFLKRVFSHYKQKVTFLSKKQFFTPIPFRKRN